MHATTSHVTQATGGDGKQSELLAHLSEVVEHAAHVLPAQGPITVFIHHNTLHAFEDKPFHEAVKLGARVFGCQPYLTEDRYREELRRGRIRFDELHNVLAQDMGDRAGEAIPCFGTRLDLRLAMLQYPLRSGPREELVWYVAEANALQRVHEDASAAVRSRLIAETRRWVVRDLRGERGRSRDGSPALGNVTELLDRFGGSSIENWTDENWEGFTLLALWRVCCHGVCDLPPYTTPPPPVIRHRDHLLDATGVDTDAMVHGLLMPFCAAFLDQGLAHWRMPGRERGFFQAFCGLYRQPLGPPGRWMRGLAGELGRLEDRGIDPLESIRESLDALGVVRDEWERFLSATLLALPGWGGMVREVENRGKRMAHPVPAGSLVGFLAIRLLLDRFALAYAARTALGIEAPLPQFWGLLRGQLDPHWPPGVEQRAFLVFQLAQVFGLSPDVLYRLSKSEWATVLQEMETFSGVERRRIFHEAYERRFATQSLDALALHVRNPAPTPRSPLFQAVFCLDEREESLRRHIEEVCPDAITFSTAGFFSIAMYYRGASDAHFTPLCPAVILPKHWVIEQVVGIPDEVQHRLARFRRLLGRVSHGFHIASRSIATGALLATSVGVLASIALVARTHFPRRTAQIRRRLGGLFQTNGVTRLRLERTESSAADDPATGPIGFTLEEMVDIAEKVLREMGLTTGFARLLLIFGHGSTSMNNPHESAHDCGACGGARGGPNARALAQILNDPRIRERLAGRDLTVPADMVAVGGMHNTSNETVTFFDQDLVPESHRDEFRAAVAVIEEACDRDAHERSRRFRSAPLTSTLASARRHVEGRAEDLAQVRPEWGHASNALCIVGRREWTRGLFLDRRAFLTSYDPAQDDAEDTILTRILQAVFPVCAGISLEYYFSYVDNNGWGSGTKLPHNITALLGVMDGAASDLRTGLPWQMVEIHEPVRLLCVIETTPESMLRLMDRNAGIGRLCRNGWVSLAVIDPDSKALSVWREGAFRPYQPQASVLPREDSSADWYRGWRDHLEFAEIGRRG